MAEHSQKVAYFISKVLMKSDLLFFSGNVHKVQNFTTSQLYGIWSQNKQRPDDMENLWADLKFCIINSSAKRS